MDSGRIAVPRPARIDSAKLLARMIDDAKTPEHRLGGPPEPAEGDVTALLDAWRAGDPAALGRLLALVQNELHRMASSLFRHERARHTLQPTALVNELYLRLARQRRVTLRNRRELFAVAGRLMRRVLVDRARRHAAEKRGGDAVHVAFDDEIGLPAKLLPEILTLDQVLGELHRRSPRQCRVVELRVLVGLTLEDIAAVEGVSPSTVSREWRAARLFLLSRLQAS